tara:strand:+ start:1000 stop:2040 length:1041 start_codon:yes stop_codon:yes gene_type:complete
MSTGNTDNGALCYNRVRFDAYRRCANEFVIGETYDANELANMLHDLRWVEVPRAFSVALYNAARKGPLRPGLARNFKELLEYVTFLAFGSAEREVVQPWYLKNWDDFFVSCVEGILSLNARDDERLLRRETIVRRAFAGVLTLVEGARCYMSLDRLAHSSAAHALLVAAGHTAHTFLWNGWTQLGGDVDEVPAGCKLDANRKMTLAHTMLMDEIASAILKTEDFNVLSWQHAFGHFAGSTKWRGFAERCKLYASRIHCEMFEISSVRILEYEVEHAYKRARNQIHKIHKIAADEDLQSTSTSNKRKATDLTPNMAVVRQRVDSFDPTSVTLVDQLGSMIHTRHLVC